jgi:hypothetical protein
LIQLSDCKAVLRCAVEVVELLAGHNTLYSQLQGVSNQLTKFRAHLSACLLFSTLANLNITPTTRVYDYDIYINIYIVNGGYKPIYNWGAL